MNPEVQRIRSDLRMAKQRLEEMRDGTRLQPTVETGGQAGAPLAWEAARSTDLPMNNGPLRWMNQLKIREADVARLEAEYCQAMLPVWTPAAVIAAMEGARPCAKK